MVQLSVAENGARLFENENIKFGRNSAFSLGVFQKVRLLIQFFLSFYFALRINIKTISPVNDLKYTLSYVLQAFATKNLQNQKRKTVFSFVIYHNLVHKRYLTIKILPVTYKFYLNNDAIYLRFTVNALNRLMFKKETRK